MNPPDHYNYCDTIIGDERHGWYCFGPRIMVSDVDVDVPLNGAAPQFWGVYRWLADELEWEWIIDMSRKEDARGLARRLLLNPDYQPEPEHIAA